MTEHTWKVYIECQRCLGQGNIKIVSGKALRDARKKKNVSLRNLALTVGVSAAFLSDIELGRRQPSAAVYEKLRKALQ